MHYQIFCTFYKAIISTVLLLTVVLQYRAKIKTFTSRHKGFIQSLFQFKSNIFFKVKDNSIFLLLTAYFGSLAGNSGLSKSIGGGGIS